MKSKPGATNVPNVLIDAFMPKLKDTEWRLLCVVVRQTIGWEDVDGNRKAQDWLSHSQLKRKTGRGSAAISQAIQDLLNRGLIAVRDKDGQMVHVASARMRRGSRLYFSLSSGLRTLIHTVSDFEIRNPEATKQTSTKRRRGNRNWQRAGELSDKRRPKNGRL